MRVVFKATVAQLLEALHHAAPDLATAPSALRRKVVFAHAYADDTTVDGGVAPAGMYAWLRAAPRKHAAYLDPYQVTDGVMPNTPVTWTQRP